MSYNNVGVGFVKYGRRLRPVEHRYVKTVTVVTVAARESDEPFESDVRAAARAAAAADRAVHGHDVPVVRFRVLRFHDRFDSLRTKKTDYCRTTAAGSSDGRPRANALSFETNLKKKFRFTCDCLLYVVIGGQRETTCTGIDFRMCVVRRV